jgi:hypothetical protein
MFFVYSTVKMHDFSKEVGLATPLHEFIYYSLLPLELRVRGKIQFPA